MDEVRWEKMFPDELENAFAKCPIIYFTYGMCEPHGPQNVLGLDALKAHGIACETAKEHGGIVAPPDYWHIHEVAGYACWGKDSIGEVKRKWLTAVPPLHHFKSICYHIRSAESLGAHAAIFLTGHYGPNWQDLKLLIKLIQPYVGTRLFGLPDYEANTPGFDNDNHSGGDHAGKVETSLMMALDPLCTDMTRLPDKGKLDYPWAMGKNANESNKKTGERMVLDEIDWLSKKAKELLDEYKHLMPNHVFRSFTDVDKFWNEIFIPRINELECIKLDFQNNNNKVPENSVWYDNWKYIVK